MIEVGANPKDVQAKAPTPASSTIFYDYIYAQQVPESQRRAVDKMMETVTQTCAR